ncbi:MAG: hypothetical protein KA100_00955 [Rickettsiales bacterium]|nr:hypothetical protein [Rickettsiales bacterium]
MREIFARKGCLAGEVYDKNGIKYAVVGEGVPTYFSVTQGTVTRYYYETAAAIFESDENLLGCADQPLSEVERATLTAMVEGLVIAEGLTLGLTLENARNNSDEVIAEVAAHLGENPTVNANEFLEQILKEMEQVSELSESEYDSEEEQPPYQHLLDNLNVDIFGQHRFQNMENWLITWLPDVPGVDVFNERAAAIFNIPENRWAFFDLGLSAVQSAAAPLETLSHLIQYHAELAFQVTPQENIADLLQARIEAIAELHPNRRRALSLGVSFDRATALPENISDEVILEFGRRLPPENHLMDLPRIGDTQQIVRERKLLNLYNLFSQLPAEDQQARTNLLTAYLLAPPPVVAPPPPPSITLNPNENQIVNLKRNGDERDR